MINRKNLFCPVTPILTEEKDGNCSGTYVRPGAEVIAAYDKLFDRAFGADSVGDKLRVFRGVAVGDGNIFF